MCEIDDIFERIRAAANRDKATDDQFLQYIVEEVGEVATCLAVGSGLKDKVLTEPTESECCDVIISTLGLLLRNQEWDLDKVVAQMSKKLERWENRLNKKATDDKNQGCTC